MARKRRALAFNDPTTTKKLGSETSVKFIVPVSREVIRKATALAQTAVMPAKVFDRIAGF